MPETAVVHLVRAKNGIEPFGLFLDSYHKCSGGVEHDLVILFKGFQSGKELAQYQLLLEGIPHRHLLLRDFGFDIRPYFVAVRKFTYTYFCFLNSFSVLLDEMWLAKLSFCIKQPKIGIVGTTGSWESSYTVNCLTLAPELPLIGRLIRQCRMKKLSRQFDPFPNYHIRTNGFLASREVLMKMRIGYILSKMDAHLFESGKKGLTKQILHMGLGIRVVGKDGKCYTPEEWHHSNTFRSADQANLLIADNQTRSYISANAETRRRLAKAAWGEPSLIL